MFVLSCDVMSACVALLLVFDRFEGQSYVKELDGTAEFTQRILLDILHAHGQQSRHPEGE